MVCADWVAPVQGEQWECIFTERLKFCDVNEKVGCCCIWLVRVSKCVLTDALLIVRHEYIVSIYAKKFGFGGYLMLMPLSERKLNSAILCEACSSFKDY